MYIKQDEKTIAYLFQFKHFFFNLHFINEHNNEQNAGKICFKIFYILH